MPSNFIYHSLPLAYVYKVTNKETGEFYIGSRYSHVSKNRTPEQDFLVHYFTSSVTLKEDIKQNTSKYQGEILYRSNETANISGNESFIVYWYEQLLIRQHISNSLCVNGQYKDPDTNTKSFMITGEAKHLTYAKTSTSLKRFYTSMTVEEKVSRGEKISKTKQNKSKEEKDIYALNCSIAAKKAYNHISAEDRAQRARRRKATMSAEQITAMRTKMRESFKKHVLITHYCDLCKRTIGGGNPTWARHLKSKAHLKLLGS